MNPTPTTQTPARLGYLMPAEWEHHQSTWFSWPRREGISFPEKFDTVPPVFAQLVRHLVPQEEVDINVWDASHENSVREALTAAKVPMERVHFHHFQSYEPWCRDHGPTFVVRERAGKREKAIVDWCYNAWGGKYPPYDLDDAIPQHVAQLRGLPVFTTDYVLEGGAFDVNGKGTVLVTESCLLHPNRNPQLTRSQIESNLREYLGVTQIIWLGEGIAGDDTDGHVDDIARFVNPTTVVTVVEEDPNDSNYQPLQENFQRLRRAMDQDRRLLKVVKLPTPGFLEHHFQRLPASYANFYIANGVVLLPTYRHRNDKVAQEILQKEFPKHKVIGIDATELIWGLGAFHCVTQQEPA